MSYSSEVLADSPYLYWRLDDTSGTAAADTSGNSRTGTYSGSPTLAQSPLITVDTSVLFDATNDYCLSSSAIFNSSTATVEVWFDYDGVVPTNYWFIAGCNEGDGSGTGDKQLVIDSTGKPAFYVFDGSPQFATGSDVLTAGTHHLVGVIDDPGDTAYVYVNGVQKGTVAAGSSFAGYSNPNVMVGGLSTARPGEASVAGRRDEFAIYTTVLSSARILAHYQAGVSAGSGIMWVYAL